MIQCKKCGANLDESVKFCGKCGTPVEAESAVNEVKNSTPKSELVEKIIKALKNKKVIKTLGAVLAVIIVIIVISAVVNGGRCNYGNCKNAAAEDSDYCFNHKCNLCDEAKTTLSSKYCYLHYSTQEKEESYNVNSDLKFSNISVSHNSSYTVVTGSVTNNGNRTYKFVKIKGAFKNSTGTVLDTDWTYAVGSEGLGKGETTTFRMSVKKNVSIRNCSITITDYK